MLVGRTVGGEVGVFVVKLCGEGVVFVVVDGDGDGSDEVGLGIDDAGPSVKSAQSSKASSSQAGCSGLGLAGAFRIGAFGFIDDAALVDILAFLGVVVFIDVLFSAEAFGGDRLLDGPSA